LHPEVLIWDTQSQSQSQAQPLPLPGPPSANAVQLDVSTGLGVRLDHLGPMVVNRDGTLSRIANWKHMTEMERSGVYAMRWIERRV
jgi:hypothetical protein